MILPTKKLSLLKIFKKVQNNIQFNFKKVENLITESNNICIIAHHNPDGDAIGSSLGLYHVLLNMNKNVNVIVPNEYAEFLQWLPNTSEVLNFYTQKIEVLNVLQNTNLIICLDFNELKRTDKLAEHLVNNKAKKILIDHHPYPQNIFDVKISDISVSSTAELVYETILQCSLDNYLSTNAAICLFTGLLTDTISFSVNCSNPRTFEVASKLLAFGLNKEEIHKNVFDNYSENRLKLLGYALSKKMEIFPEYSTGFIWLTKVEQEKFNFMIGDSEGFVNYPLSIKGINFSALFMERDDHIKISFRSRGNISVNEIIKTHFSGGGHKNAAGGEEYNLNITETINKFCSILPNYSEILKQKQ